MEGRKVDEDDMIGCSVEAMFQNDHDIKIDQDESKTCMVPFDGPHIVNNSIVVEEPYVGQEFDSEAAAHAFYNSYATKVGFVIRVSKLSRSRRDGSAIGRALVCNKEGFRTPDKREKIVRQRAETRVGCRAMVLFRKISSGKWVITKFVKEHTHPLAPGKGRRDLIYDQYPNEHDKIRELSQQLAIEKKRSATYKRHLEMVFEYIDEHNQSLSKRIEDVVNNVSAMESKDIETVDKEQMPLEDDMEKIEIPAQREVSLCDAQEPYEGMLFESEEAATMFYNDYALRVGFVARVLSSRKSERDGTMISRGLGCRGDLQNNKNDNALIKKKNKGGETCAAMILLKREKPGNWVVRKFVREHNHPLHVSISKKRPSFDEKDKIIQELSAELRVKKRLSAAYREQLVALMQDVDGHNEHLSSKVQVVRNSIKKLEARNGHVLQK